MAFWGINGRRSLVKVRCSSVGDKAGVGGWGSTLIEAGEGGCDRKIPEGKPGKGIMFEM
jgi:hypothetical protein